MASRAVLLIAPVALGLWLISSSTASEPAPLFSHITGISGPITDQAKVGVASQIFFGADLRTQPFVPGSFVTHCVHLWRGSFLPLRAAFLSQVPRQSKQSEELFQLAISLNPDDVDSLFHFAQYFHQIRENPGEAEKLYQAVLDLDATHVGAMCNYGLLLSSPPLKQWGYAEELFETALELNPRHSETLCNYAMLQSVRDDGRQNYNSSDFLYQEAMMYSDWKPAENKVGNEEYHEETTISAIAKK